MFAAKATEQDSGMTMRMVRTVGIGALLAVASTAGLSVGSYVLLMVLSILLLLLYQFFVKK